MKINKQNIYIIERILNLLDMFVDLRRVKEIPRVIKSGFLNFVKSIDLNPKQRERIELLNDLLNKIEICLRQLQNVFVVIDLFSLLPVRVQSILDAPRNFSVFLQ